MNTEMYTLLAMFARYFFAGLMVVVVFRAWRITIKDNRRAKVLRDWSPETGCVGELLVNPENKRRQVHPIPREGVLGSSRKADIRVKYKDVLPMHAHIEEREGGLLIRPLGRAKVALGKGLFTGEQLFAKDGDMLNIGKQKMMIVLFEPGAPAEETPPEIERIRPLKGARTAAPEDDYDEFFDEEKLWQDDGK